MQLRSKKGSCFLKKKKKKSCISNKGSKELEEECEKEREFKKKLGFGVIPRVPIGEGGAK
jgi:hypothetical protein